MCEASPGPGRLSSWGWQASRRFPPGTCLLDPERLTTTCSLSGLGSDELFRVLTSLQTQRLVEMHFVPPNRATLLRLTGAGFRAHLQAVGYDLPEIQQRVLSTLEAGTVPWRGGDAVDLAGAVRLPSLVVEAALEDLREAGRVVFTPASGRRVRVHKLSLPAPRPG